jgi:hypothetical protein
LRGSRTDLRDHGAAMTNHQALITPRCARWMIVSPISDP